MYIEALSSDLNYTKDQDKKLKKSCEEFEALFMAKVFSSMRETIQDGGLVKKSTGEEIFTEMLDAEVAKESSEGEGLGLSKMLYESMSKNLHANNGNNFPTGKNSAVNSQQFLELQRELNGTNVASTINEKL
ncbi:Flagellar protein FlgJ-like protein [Denitrovibrio acetiphilus DSM 12809]|jgi:flagellar protein FlgJ|uniref:Flagellar protein FlgJ-like protein n=1 Tax=Denitrovibrio acetiphilus (strain DSM 12809 / NBRC 114555 / N2460) TaxID=522772 RepID=D4H4A6_DENA2|nr:rod-binding protein [Denitrovibrio acetiphilus]ADD69235.1 Flagellar protein FlgJ-like protein [Denitrovibrio acetiphilus DSM 12809]